MSPVRLYLLVIAALVAGLGFACLSALYYHAQSLQKTAEITKLIQMRDSLQVELRQKEQQQQQVAMLDRQYTKELTDARTENEQLRAALESGAQRLHLNANCPRPVSTPTAAARLDDAVSPRLNESAERDYIRLTGRIKIATAQITGLQDYISTICQGN
jgi:prophage endopeptidase